MVTCEMKIAFVWFFILAVVSGDDAAAQENMKRWSPGGADSRIGRGYVNRASFLPDGALIAVATSFGVWLYDAKTYLR